MEIGEKLDAQIFLHIYNEMRLIGLKSCDLVKEIKIHIKKLHKITTYEKYMMKSCFSEEKKIEYTKKFKNFMQLKNHYMNILKDVRGQNHNVQKDMKDSKKLSYGQYYNIEHIDFLERYNKQNYAEFFNKYYEKFGVD